MFLVDDHQEVIVKECLQTGNREYLGFSLNQSYPNTECGVWALETYVEPMVILRVSFVFQLLNNMKQ